MTQLSDSSIETAIQSDEPQHLPLPATVRIGKVRWIYAIPIAILHLLAFAAVVPWLFSWTGLIICILGIHVFGQGINIGYHRLLTHRCMIVPRWLEYTIVTIALCCMEDSPARWVANHRFHHKYSDTQPDPHSPWVNFIWGHVGWLMFHNAATDNIGAYREYAKGVIDDPFYMKLQKNPLLVLGIYLAQIPLFFLIGGAVGYFTAATGENAWVAALQFGLSLVVWGVIVRTVAVWHITWSVNSLSHLFGYQNYNTGEHSTNNWLVALLTVGEGWHNNHHHDPSSASNQHRWWEIDISYYEILLLEKLGLAKRVIPTVIKRKAIAAEKEALRNS